MKAGDGTLPAVVSRVVEIDYPNSTVDKFTGAARVQYRRHSAVDVFASKFVQIVEHIRTLFEVEVALYMDEVKARSRAKPKERLGFNGGR